VRPSGFREVVLPKPTDFAAHEVGTMRMGKDPRTSGLNGYCQAHDVKNLFPVDCSVFTTSDRTRCGFG